MLPAWAAELLCTGGASGFIPSRITHVGYSYTYCDYPTHVYTTYCSSHNDSQGLPCRWRRFLSYCTQHQCKFEWKKERKRRELGLWPYSSVSSDILGDFFSKKNNGQGWVDVIVNISRLNGMLISFGFFIDTVIFVSWIFPVSFLFEWVFFWWLLFLFDLFWHFCCYCASSVYVCRGHLVNWA